MSEKQHISSSKEQTKSDLAKNLAQNLITNEFMAQQQLALDIKADLDQISKVYAKLSSKAKKYLKREVIYLDDTD